jgi:hypothetical protein
MAELVERSLLSRRFSIRVAPAARLDLGEVPQPVRNGAIARGILVTASIGTGAARHWAGRCGSIAAAGRRLLN